MLPCDSNYIVYAVTHLYTRRRPVQIHFPFKTGLFGTLKYGLDEWEDQPLAVNYQKVVVQPSTTVFFAASEGPNCWTPTM